MSGFTSFTGFVWTEGQFVLNCEICGFKNIRIRVEGALVNVLRKVSKTKYCYIAEVHCQTIVSRGSRVRGKKNKQEKHSNQNRILKDSNMRSQHAERAGAEVCLFALFDCILSKGRDNHRLPLLSKASCHTRYLYCSGNMWFLCFCLSLLNSVRMS